MNSSCSDLDRQCAPQRQRPQHGHRLHKVDQLETMRRYPAHGDALMPTLTDLDELDRANHSPVGQQLISGHNAIHCRLACSDRPARCWLHHRSASTRWRSRKVGSEEHPCSQVTGEEKRKEKSCSHSPACLHACQSPLAIPSRPLQPLLIHPAQTACHCLATNRHLRLSVSLSLGASVCRVQHCDLLRVYCTPFLLVGTIRKPI